MYREEESEEEFSSRAQHAKKPIHAFQSYMNAIMLSVVGFLVILVFMAYMTKLSFGGDLDWKEVGFQTVFLYGCTVSISLILRSYARRKGRETEAWRSSREEVEKNNRAIIDGGQARYVAEYCRAWEEWDVDGARYRILSEADVSLEAFKAEYRLYTKKELEKKFPSLTKEQRRAIAKAKRVRRLHYDESYLSVREHTGRRTAPSGGIKTRTISEIQTVKTLVMTAVSSLFSVSVVAELIVDPSFANVVACLIKIGVLLISGTMCIIKGYQFSAVREVEEMSLRADEQRRFLRWCAAKNYGTNCGTN